MSRHMKKTLAHVMIYLMCFFIAPRQPERHMKRSRQMKRKREREREKESRFKCKWLTHCHLLSPVALTSEASQWGDVIEHQYLTEAVK